MSPRVQGVKGGFVQGDSVVVYLPRAMRIMHRGFGGYPGSHSLA